MGTYLNPGNSGFALIRNSLYVDKSGLIRLVNETIDTTEQLTCVSRPRRFGEPGDCKRSEICGLLPGILKSV